MCSDGFPRSSIRQTADKKLYKEFEKWVRQLSPAQAAYIVPKAYAETVGLSEDTVRQLFIQAVRQGLLAVGLDLMCPRCKNWAGRYASEADLPLEPLVCPVCEESFIPADYTEFLYVSFTRLPPDEPHATSHGFQKKTLAVL